MRVTVFMLAAGVSVVVAACGDGGNRATGPQLDQKDDTSTMPLFERKKVPPVDSLPVEPRFAVSKGMGGDGRRFVIRRNVSIEPLAGHPEYRHRVGIAVPRRGDDLSELGKIEDELAAEFERDHESLLAVVVTGDDFQEFVYYTRDPAAATGHRQAVAAKFPDHDLQMYVEPDPEWVAYEEFSR